MKRILFFLIFSCILSFSSSTQAQVVGKYLEKKVKQATNRAADKADEEVTDEMNKKVDKGVENVFDKILGPGEEKETENPSRIETGETENTTRSSSSNRASDAAAKSMLKSMGINTAPANVPENYEYKGNILMKVQSWDQDGNSEGEVDYTTYMTSDNSGFAMEFEKQGERSVMIFDYVNGFMIIMAENNGEKTGIVTPYASYVKDSLQDIQTEGENENVEDFSVYNPNLKKTGRSRKIAGYSCDEYIYEDDETEGAFWMTGDLPAELWSNMFSANVISAGATGYYGGFVMEMEQKEKNTGEKTFMQVQEVNRDQMRAISTKGYQLMSFGGGQQ